MRKKVKKARKGSHKLAKKKKVRKKIKKKADEIPRYELLYKDYARKIKENHKKREIK